MNKKAVISIIIALIVVAVGLVSCLVLSNNVNKNEYQSEFTMVVEARKFLKTKVNYPDTFDYVNYPNVTWYDDEIVYVIISGEFKSANAFNVYAVHKFAVAMNPKNCEVISYKIN